MRGVERATLDLRKLPEHTVVTVSAAAFARPPRPAPESQHFGGQVGSLLLYYRCGN